MRSIIHLLFLSITFITCIGQTQQKSMLVSSKKRINEKVKRYYGQIKLFEEKNNFTTAILINEWEEYNCRYAKRDSDIGKLLERKNYKLKINGVSKIHIVNEGDLLKFDREYLVEFYIIGQSISINSENIFDLSQYTDPQELIIHDFKLLSSEGLPLEIVFTFKGKINCSTDEFIYRMVDENLQVNYVENKIKSAIRNVVGRYNKKTVVGKIEDGTLIIDIKDKLKLVCFDKDSLKIEIKQ